MLYGLDISTATIELAAYKHDQQIVGRKVATPTYCYHAFKSTIKNLVIDADRELRTRGSVGISMPGMIHQDTLKSFCTNIPCANNRNLVSDLEFILNRPVRIENNANCFTLSECTRGPGTGTDIVLGVEMGHGFGCGLLSQGKLHRGRNNMAGEWGHTPLPFNIFDFGGKDFPVLKCHCGKEGCLDQYLCASGLERIHLFLTDEKLSATEILDINSREKTSIQKTVNIFYHLLASSLVSMINSLDPDMIILGGIVTDDKQLLKELPELLCEYSLPSSRLPDIRTSAFGDSSTIRGAALLNA